MILFSEFAGVSPGNWICFEETAAIMSADVVT